MEFRATDAADREAWAAALKEAIAVLGASEADPADGCAAATAATAGLVDPADDRRSVSDAPTPRRTEASDESAAATDAAAGAAAPRDALLRAFEVIAPHAVLRLHLSRALEGCRRDELAAAREWLTGDLRLLWLHGGAGTGKSTLASVLAAELGAAAVHFVQRDAACSRDAGLLVGSIAHQLRGRLSSLRLDGALPRHAGVESPRALFQRVIGAPLALLGDGDVPAQALLLVVDALDEAASDEGCNFLLDMMPAVAELPPWVKVIVTSAAPPMGDLRRGARVLQLDGPDGERGLRDIAAAALAPWLPRRAAAREACVTSLLARATGGAALYCDLLRRVLPPEPPADIDEEFIDECPDDLGSLFAECVGAAAARAPGPELLPLLEVLAVVRAPLPGDVVAAAADVSVERASAALAALAAAGLAEARSDGRVAVRHALIGAWLLDAAQGGVVVAARGHARLAWWSRQVVFGDSLGGAPDALGAPATRARAKDLAPNADAPAERYAFAFHVAHVVAGEPLMASSADGGSLCDTDAWLGDALTDVALVDGAAECDGLDLLVSQMWSIVQHRDPSRLRARIQPYVTYFFAVARCWRIDRAAAILPALCGKFGAAVAADVAAWAARRYPAVSDALYVALPPVTWPVAASLGLVFGGHASGVSAVCVSPRGGVLVTGSASGTHVRSAGTGAAALELARGATVCALAYASDGSALAGGTGAPENAVLVWDTANWELRHTLGGHSGGVLIVRFLATPSRLASCGADWSVRLWDVVSGACSRVVPFSKGFGPIALSPNGDLLMCGGDDKCVHVFGIASGAKKGRALVGHAAPVRSFAFSPDESLWASGGDDCSVRLWESEMVVRTLNGHSSAVMCLTFSHDGQRLASGGLDVSIRLWSVPEGACVGCLSGHGGASASCLDFFPDGARLAAGFDAGSVIVFDVLGGARDGAPAPHAVSARTRSACVSGDGRLVVSGGDDRVVRMRSASTGAIVAEMTDHVHHVSCVAISPDGLFIASGGGGGDRTVRVWLAASGALVHALGGHGAIVRGVAWSRDSRIVASAGEDRTVRVWDVLSGSPKYVLRGHSADVMCVAFARDDRLLASGAALPDATVRIWDAASGALRSVIGARVASVLCVCFTADGCIAVGDATGTVRVLDVVTAALVREMRRRHDGGVLTVDVSQDGARIVSGARDGSVFVGLPGTGACTCAMYVPHAVSSVKWLRSLPDVDVIGVGFRDFAPTACTCLVVTRGGTGVRIGRCGRDTMLDDDAVPACPLCCVLFSVVRRRHHCRSCGGVFCDGCSGIVASACNCVFCREALTERDRRLCAPCRIAHDAGTASAEAAGPKTPCNDVLWL